MTQILSSCKTQKTFSVWLTQGFSSQRDILMALNSSSIKSRITTIASHREQRDEILSMADVSVIEPKVDGCKFILEQTIAQQVDLVLVSHFNAKYEQQRDLFEQHGITLITGTRGANAHHVLEDKFEFTQQCQQADIAVVDAIKVESTLQLQNAINCLQQQGNVCVKPVVGVFAQGFWQLINDINYFDNLFDPTNYQVNTQQFIEAYDKQELKRPYLVMPFLSGEECSVDMFCVAGQVMNMVTRMKKDQWQEVLPIGPCDDIVIRLAQVFQLDGIINAQFRQDRQGKWYVLEVNSRPSGGIGMTLHSHINLMAECVAYYSKLSLNRLAPKTALVRAVSHSVEVGNLTHAKGLYHVL